MLLARKWILMENPKLFFDGKVAIVHRAVPFELFLHVVIMKQLWAVRPWAGGHLKSGLMADVSVNDDTVRKARCVWQKNGQR